MSTILGKNIKSIRKSCGISQQKLASLSEVSLATLQNIELGIANPSLKVIDSLLNSLGLQFEITSQYDCWEVLTFLGLPFGEMKEFKISKNKDTLFLYLHQCLRSLSDKDQEDYERKYVSIQSLVMALKDHYPSKYKKFSKTFDFLYPEKVTGKHIKLRRLAISNIARYL